MTSCVTVLLIWGTLLEMWLTYKLKQKRLRNKCSKELVTDSSSGIGCTTYDLTDAVPNKHDLPIGISMPKSMNNNNSDENLSSNGSSSVLPDDEKFGRRTSWSKEENFLNLNN